MKNNLILIGENTEIGTNTIIDDFAVIGSGCTIGNNCKIHHFTHIDNKVRIGNNVKIQDHVMIPHGVTLEDGVFVGPSVAFSNDKYPRSKEYGHTLPTLVKRGATIGAGCTVLCGITIGEKAMIGAGSVVTKDVPAGELWVGNPAKFVRKIDC